MITRVTSEGRIGIPARLRKEVGIVDGDLMDAECENGKIVLTPLEPRCQICQRKEPITVSGLLICPECLTKIKSAHEANTPKGE